MACSVPALLGTGIHLLGLPYTPLLRLEGVCGGVLSLTGAQVSTAPHPALGLSDPALPVAFPGGWRPRSLRVSLWSSGPRALGDANGQWEVSEELGAKFKAHGSHETKPCVTAYERPRS